MWPYLFPFPFLNFDCTKEQTENNIVCFCCLKKEQDSCNNTRLFNKIMSRAFLIKKNNTNNGGEEEDDGDITTEQIGYVLKISLNRPDNKNYNAFTPKMFQKLGEAFTLLEKTDSVRCGVLVGNGRHFCAGIDMAKTTFDAKLFPIGEVDPCNLYPPKRTKPLICAVHGVTFTVGLEVALAGDVIIAAKGCRFGQLEVKRGTISFFGGTFRIMERAGYSNAMRYLLTGDEFNEVEAKEMGLVQEIVDTPELAKEKAMELANKISQQAPLAVMETLKSANMALQYGAETAINALAGQVRYLRETKDFAEGVLSFKEKRDAVYTGE